MVPLLATGKVRHTGAAVLTMVNSLRKCHTRVKNFIHLNKTDTLKVLGDFETAARGRE
jgi:hypothetical protein